MVDSRVEKSYQKLVTIGLKKGSLNEEDIYDKMIKLEVDEPTIKEYISNLKAKGIRIIPEIKCADNDNINRIMEEATVSDSVKTYLRDIVLVQLLT